MVQFGEKRCAAISLESFVLCDAEKRVPRINSNLQMEHKVFSTLIFLLKGGASDIRLPINHVDVALSFTFGLTSNDRSVCLF